MAKKKTKKLPLTFSPRHGPISGVGNAALGLTAVCAATEAWSWGLEPWWALAAAGGGMVISQIGAHVARKGISSRIYQAACWSAGGAWTGFVLDNTLWDLPTVATGAGIAGAAALAAPVVADLERSRGKYQRAVQDDQRRMRLAAQWQARLYRVCRINGARIMGIAPWKYPDPATGKIRKTGYTLEVLVPQGGQGWSTIAHHRDALISDLDLPAGCSLTVEPGASTRKALVHVNTVNCLVGDIPLSTPETLPASINDPLDIGLTTRGKPVRVPLKWASGVLVGAKRQGKSNTLKSLTRQALRCDDVLIMGIDPNGGAAFSPFLRPWLEGKAKRPAIDWVGVSEAEIIRMLKFLLGAVERRRSGYAQHMWENGGDDKLAVSHRIPHILLLTDESKSLSHEAKKLLVQINDRGGAASVSMLTSWLRAIAATREGLPRDLLVQSEVRLTMRVTEDAELRYAFSEGRGVPSASEAPAPGWGHYRVSPTSPAELYKSARSTDRDAYEEAIATAQWRPWLDAVTIGPEREVYEGRWRRAMEEGWLAKLCPQGVAVDLAAVPATVQAPHGAGGGDDEAVSAEQRRAARRERSAQWRERMRKKREGRQEPLVGGGGSGSSDGDEIRSDDEIRREFEAMVAGLQDEDLEQQEQPLPPFLKAVLELLDRLDTTGVHSSVLAEHLTQGDKESAAGLMKALEIQKSAGTFRMRGHPQYGSHRGWKRKSIEEAATRIRNGHPVPLQVFDWQPPT